MTVERVSRLQVGAGVPIPGQPNRQRNCSRAAKLRGGAIAALFMVASCAAHDAKEWGLRSVPPDLGEVAWTVSPADVVGEQLVGTPVVWVGQVVEFTYSRRDGKLVLEWIWVVGQFES
jgi:hypothetical protein